MGTTALPQFEQRSVHNPEIHRLQATRMTPGH
jgi:hypothetical protein